MDWQTIETNHLFFWGATTWDITPSSGGNLLAATFPQGQEDTIKNALKNLYETSQTARMIIDEAIANFGGLRFAYDPGELGQCPMPPGRDGSTTRYVLLDATAFSDFFYFNPDGQLVNEKLELLLIHELAHISSTTIREDALPWTEAQINAGGYNFDGDVLPLQDNVALEMGYLLNDQVSYVGLVSSDPRYFQIPDGTEIGLARGDRVDVVRFGDWSGAENNILDMTQYHTSDLLMGFSGDDTLSGGDHNDYIYGGIGSDTINGGAEHDYAEGGDDEDTLNGDAGYDELHGGGSIDTIHGGADGDVLFGEGGNDILFGDDGGDTLHGGEGEDTLDGGADFDIVSFQYAEEGVVVRRDGGILRGFGSQTSDSYRDTMTGFEEIDGSEYSDELELLDAGMWVFGLGGGDLIRGGGGDDFIYGGDGSNVMIGGGGRDEIFGGANSDFIRADGQDTMLDNVPAIFGDAGHDAIVIQGAASDVTVAVQGGAGNDYVKVGANISLDYYFNSGDGNEHIVLEEGAAIGMLNVDSDQSQWSGEFYLESAEFSHSHNDGAYHWYRAFGSFVLINGENGDSITIENFDMGFLVEKEFTDIDHITMNDVYGYGVNVPGIFNSASFDNMQGSRMFGQPWEISGGAFELFANNVENVHDSALDDFNAARTDGPLIPSELWLT